jgi:ribosomal protein L7/L12
VEVWSIVIFVIAISLVISAGSERGQCEERYRKLEKKYNELAIRTGNPELATTFISEKDLDAIRQLKAQNKIVQAVKLTRTLTEMGLREAKQYVDDL